MLPEIVVLALMAPPVAETLVSVKFPLAAVNVILPAKVVADVTKRPPVVSAILMTPDAPASAVNPPVVA
jgi:hypothetical protein